jgi:hypothetical protein
MNEDGQCVPLYKPCPRGYWRADDDESGACVPIRALCILIFPPPPGCPGYNPALISSTPGGNLTDGSSNATDTDTDMTPQPNATDTTPPDIPPVNLTQSDSGGGAGGANESIIPEPLIECPEGEQFSPDGLSCVPIVTEEPIECPEGEQTCSGWTEL